MSLLLRALARAVGVLWTLVLALVGLGVALYCLDGAVRLGSLRPDRLVHLSAARRHVGHFLDQISAPGVASGLALLGGLGAIAIGLLLLSGVLRGAKEREAVLDAGEPGRITARKRALRDLVRALAENTDGIAAISRPRIRLSRRATRGRLRLGAARTRTADPEAVKQALTARLEPVCAPFNLRPRISVRLGEQKQRVQ